MPGQAGLGLNGIVQHMDRLVAELQAETARLGGIGRGGGQRGVPPDQPSAVVQGTGGLRQGERLLGKDHPAVFTGAQPGQAGRRAKGSRGPRRGLVRPVRIGPLERKDHESPVASAVGGQIVEK